jgi:hypothetical protein
MSDDIKAYELLVHLFDDNYQSVISLSELKKISYELSLFYLLIIIVYANNSSIESINNSIFKKKIDYTKTTDLLKCQLIHQLSCAYINNENFTTLFEHLQDIDDTNKPILIHIKYINILQKLHNRIFSSNSKSSSKSSSLKKSIKSFIEEIYDLVIKSAHPTNAFIRFKSNTITKIIDLLDTIISMFYQFEIESPFDTLSKDRTDVDDLDNLDDNVSKYSDKLQELISD